MIVDKGTIEHLWPETVLVILAVWILVGGAFQQSRWWWSTFSLASYAVVAYVICRNEIDFLSLAERNPGVVISGPIVVDYLGFVLRLLAVLVGFLFTLVAARIVPHVLASEFIGTLMLLVVGIMLVARANDLVLLFVGLELISIPTYVLLYLGRRDRATTEATAKYFFLTIFSSAVLLYGLSFLYGLTGTTVLIADPLQTSVAGILSGQAATPLMSLGLILIVAGLGFKIAAVPFHFYAPDVYQGATNGNAGLLAIAPKIGGLAALVRVLVVAMPSITELAWQLLLVISIASMTLGNVCALWQNNLRRLMAFSSIAHAGYLLIGVVVSLGAASQATGNGVGAATLYVIVYTLATAGIFAALAYLGGTVNEVNGVDDLSGLGKTDPLTAAVLAICIISLAGIPPLAGFWGKLTLFSGAIQAATSMESGFWFAVLAIAGALNAAIAVAYYLRIVSVMYFGQPKREYHGDGGWGARAAMIFAAALVVFAGVFPGTLIPPSRHAEQSLQRAVQRPTRAAAVANYSPQTPALNAE